MPHSLNRARLLARELSTSHPNKLVFLYRKASKSSSYVMFDFKITTNMLKCLNKVLVGVYHGGKRVEPHKNLELTIVSVKDLYPIDLVNRG